MGKIRRQFDVQVKIRVCQAIEAGTPMREICRDNQLQRAVVESWMQKYVNDALDAKSDSRQSELERENEKLKAKVGELTMHIDLLKKMGDWKKQQTSASSSIITSKKIWLSFKRMQSHRPCHLELLLQAESEAGKEGESRCRRSRSH